MPDYADDAEIARLKTLPYSLQAEQAVIGGLLISPHGFDAIADLITENDFFRPAHRIAFREIAKLVDRGIQPETIALCNALDACGELERAGGHGYLMDLANNTPSAANLRAYANAVRERAILRNLITAAQSIAGSAFEPGDRTSAELLDDAQRVMMEISDGSGTEADLHVSAGMVAYIEELNRRSECEGLVGLSTGFTALDNRTNGLIGGELIIIAGRPGSGKTTLAMNIAEHVGLSGGGVLVFSMEMQRMQLIDRMVSSVGGIPFASLRSGAALSNEYHVKITPAFDRIKRAPIFIDERGALTVQQMRATARRQHKKSPLSLIVIDYLQLARAKAENRVNEITAISQGLKALAKELKIPVIALSQLSRKCEEQKRRPISSDLRDSGSIEQDADSIFLIYRDEVYNPDNQHTKGLAEIICTKLRNGEPGMDFLKSNLAMCRFENHEPGFKPVEPEPESQSRKGAFDY